MYNISVFNKIIAVILIFLLSSCNQDSRLLLKIENREIKKDKITEYRFFENGLVNITVTYSDSEKDLFSSKFHKLKSKEIISILNKLQKLNYHNDFPWQEDFYQRGDVIKIEFLDKIEIQIPKENKIQTIQAPQTYYFYTGHEANTVFKEIQNLLQSIPN